MDGMGLVHFLCFACLYFVLWCVAGIIIFKNGMSWVRKQRMCCEIFVKLV